MDDDYEPKHVLFVDDEPTMHRLVQAALRHEDLRLTCVADGAQALRVLERAGVDLLVTSLTLPVVDGVDLLRHLANRCLTIPVIVTTDRTPPPALPRSPLRFLREPLQPAAIAASVRERLAAPPPGGAIAIAELAQILALERRTCTLRAQSNGVHGELAFNAGALVDATVGAIDGEAAARVLLAWRRAMLRLEPLARRKTTIQTELAALLPSLADSVDLSVDERVASVAVQVSSALHERRTPRPDPPRPDPRPAPAPPTRRPPALYIVPESSTPPPPVWEPAPAQKPAPAPAQRPAAQTPAPTRVPPWEPAAKTAQKPAAQAPIPAQGPAAPDPTLPTQDPTVKATVSATPPAQDPAAKTPTPAQAPAAKTSTPAQDPAAQAPASDPGAPDPAAPDLAAQPTPSPPAPAPLPVWEQPAAQPRIAALLTDALKIEGAIGVALGVWELDDCLGVRAREPELPVVTMRGVLSGHSRVLRAMMMTMKRLGRHSEVADVLIMLDAQIHVLVPLPRHDGLFLDLALDRRRSNLALARMRVAALLQTFRLDDLTPAP